MVSLGSTSRVSVFPVIVLTKICMGTRQEGGEAEAEERRAGCARVWVLLGLYHKPARTKVQ